MQGALCGYQLVPGTESTSKEMRYRWILNSTRHLPNVMIRMVEDQALTKEEYDTPGYWEQGCQGYKGSHRKAY